MGIISWLGKKTDNAVLRRCEDTLKTALLASDADAAYLNVVSITVWNLFERLFEQPVHDPVEFLTTLQSQIEDRGANHAAALSKRLLKSISNSNTPATVIVGVTLIASWVQLIGLSQRTSGPIAMNKRAWKLLGNYQSLFLQMARQSAAPSSA